MIIDKSYPNMLWQALLLVLTASALVFYFFYYRPKSMCQTYAHICRQLGYKVYVEPFCFLGHHNVLRYKNDRDHHRDATYSQKHLFAGYDVIIGNILHFPVIYIASPNSDKVDTLEKVVFALRLFKSLIPSGLLFTEGDTWRKSKKILSKVFNYDFMAQQIPNIIKISNQTLDKYESREENSKGNQCRFRVSQVGMGVFSGVVLSSFLGFQASSELIEGVPIQEAVVKMFSEAGKMMMTDMSQLFFGPNFMKLGMTKNHREFVARKQRIRSLIKSQVQKVSEEMNQGTKKTGSVATIVEAIVAESLKGEEGYSLEKMVDEIITFIFAGSDTTTNMFTSAVLLLYSHPQALQKAMQEVNRIIKSDSDLSRENLKQLTYLEAIQYETLRMYSPIHGNLGRKAKQDCFLGDVPIPKGTVIGIMYRPMLNDPDVFPDPHIFRPERWFSQQAKQHINLVSFAFSGGPRTCIGKHLALLESKILLVKMLQRYKSIEQLHQRVFNAGIVLNIVNSEVKATKFE